MKMPGNNEIRLNSATVAKIVEEALNRDAVGGEIRVTAVKFEGGYTPELVATVTTDPLPATKETTA